MTDQPDKNPQKFSLRAEVQTLKTVLADLDKQVVVVLLFSALAMILQMNLGDRSFFRTDIAPRLGVESAGLGSWGWWFGLQGVLGFVIPVLILKYGFKRTANEMGLGLGDWKFALVVAAVYVPFVLIGTWVLSDSGSFQSSYPHYGQAALDWRVFLVYEAIFIFYWMGWEYLWRGFVLFGTARVLGIYAIFVQTVPFAILHYEKPMPEALLSIVGGVALGALVWRARSFWIAVPIHATQMLFLDFFCSLRIRTGVSGSAPSALIEILEKL